MCVCVSVCVFTLEVPFKRLFAPFSRSQMSKLIRFSELLGKSNGKKWSKICKIAAQKKSVFRKIFLTSRIFLVSVLLSASVKRFFVFRMRDFFFVVFTKTGGGVGPTTNSFVIF